MKLEKLIHMLDGHQMLAILKEHNSSLMIADISYAGSVNADGSFAAYRFNHYSGEEAIVPYQAHIGIEDDAIVVTLFKD